MADKNKGVYIPSIDGKDIFLANGINDEVGFTLKMKNGSPNLRRYKNVFDYSIDLIDLRKVAKSTYWGKDDKLSFKDKGKEYCPKIINLNFKYPVREFNKITTTENNVKYDVYIKYTHKKDDLEFIDCVARIGDEVVGVICGKDIIRPQELNGFECIANKNKEDGVSLVYKFKSSKTLYKAKEIRESIYKDGFICDGTKYVRFKRSSGSARVGKCLFIAEELYSEMFKLAKCGLKVEDEQEIDLASFEAYISLTTSSIIDTIKIEPKNFLIIDDFSSVFEEEAIITEIVDGNRLNTRQGDAIVNNSIFDGQGLIDISLMGEYKDKGMLLLRNNFFKSCCFNTNIQKFFKDNNITEISQLKGFTLADSIEDIKLITTPSSIKYYKFEKDVSKWFSNISDTFGIVKHDKDTHYFDGELVQTHYQLINTLQFTKDEMQTFLNPSIEYLDALNMDKHVMRNHIKWKANEVNDDEEEIEYNLETKNDIIYTMLGYDNGFDNTKMYADFKRDVRNSFIKNIKKGHVYINGTYAVLLGNPYEMLLSSIGQFDGTGYMQKGTVHNIRYKDGEDLLGCRSPHVTISNILLAKNKHYAMIDEYFNLSHNIVCINSINENTLERLSSADFDSDSMIITNEKLLIDLAKINYDVFKVPTSMVEAIKTKRYYNKTQLADLDIKTSNNKIGEIINLSQILNSLLWNKLYDLKKDGEIRGSAKDNYDKIKELFYDICQLDVMSCIEIDKAKKEFVIDNTKELSLIREKYKEFLTDDNGRQIKPKFFEFLAKSKGYYVKGSKSYDKHETAMDYLSETTSERGRCTRKQKENFTLFSNVFIPLNYDSSSINKRQLKDIRKKCSLYVEKRKAIWSNEFSDSKEKRIMNERIRDDLIQEVSLLNMNETTTYELIKTIDMDKYKEIVGILSFLLFQVNNESMNNLINCLKIDKEIRRYSYFGVEFNA